MHFLSINWDPSEGIDLGFFMIRYYSLMFVVAFALGWFLMKKIYLREGLTVKELDSLFIYTVLATLIGARLGHFLFYEPEMFIKDPLYIFLPVEFSPKFRIVGFRGLASHGAAIGIIIAMYYYCKKVIHKPLLWILDRVVIPVSIGGVFVRFGNFMNSEIIGRPTNSDFGVVFQQLGETFPRHPSQLYEAAGYVLVFLILWYIYWKTDKREKQGYIFGLFLILLWAVRFIVEFFKENQVAFEDKIALNMGQWLSIPFILIGFYLIYRSTKITKPEQKS
ncbi:prolipoprotein diacylglyceryl transferase [Sinomicrobium weinanense]|uniref:Phosphatidylglycerol--prolipoprotein diacylglyceryl transferase n=1 Tax=Sinomicrobium weinanense TaxID=2842200 RepID=A0A926JS61_9FLAO|nr:prolipoprotein diacylglyceryl transferase [Sinomicrobium weinanense]MBC9796530.1 prolipoprotein diacylglyceryl transferase [Sinomicrobium weinanense]MBU3123546.1 prolipoprotein diacylglyceryl transferase [Sinomicrobium weinanense]